MSTSKVKLLKYQNQSAHIILHFFFGVDLFWKSHWTTTSSTTSLLVVLPWTHYTFCHYEQFLPPLYIAVPRHRVSRNSSNIVGNRMTVRKSSHRELILCTVSLILLVWCTNQWLSDGRSLFYALKAMRSAFAMFGANERMIYKCTLHWSVIQITLSSNDDYWTVNTKGCGRKRPWCLHRTTGENHQHP
jgi:hypothetical protein